MKILAILLLLFSAVPVYATTGNTTVERKQTTTVERDDDSDFGDWGLLGLLGLAGLAGLLKKDRHDATARTTYESTRKNG